MSDNCTVWLKSILSAVLSFWHKIFVFLTQALIQHTIWHFFCHISITIVVCDNGDIQTCARHTELSVVNFLPLQLSSYAFIAFFSSDVLVSFCCANKEVRCWSCKAFFGLSFVRFHPELVGLIAFCDRVWQDIMAAVCNRGGPSAPWLECEAKKKKRK